MGNALPFQLTEEAFTGCVVAAMPDCTHAADQRVAIRKALVVGAGELATDPNAGSVTLALPDRHFHRSDHPLPILTVMHRPTDHQLVVQIEHHAKKQLALPCGDLRYIRDPLTFRL